MSAANTVKVACVGYVFVPAAQDIIREIAPDGFELSFAENWDAESEKWVEESDFLFVVSPVTSDMIARAPKLKMIQKWGIGVDKIDLPAAEKAGVFVAITAGANAATVAEHTIMHMLATMRRLPLADRAMKEGRWIVGDLRPQSRKLAGKTVGILGFGNIGKAVAARLQGFGVKIIYHDILGPMEEAGRKLNASYVGMEDLLTQSDVLTLHIPGGKANYQIIGKAAIAKMKPEVTIINCARGDLIDEDALAEALTSGKVLGAGLDTFEKEPIQPGQPATRLMAFPNVVATPHSAGSVLDNVAPMAAHGLENIQRLLHGEKPSKADLIVDPAKPRMTGVVAR